MPTSTKVKNLNINELTEAQYDAAVQGGVIGANELSVLTDVSYVEPSDLATVATTGDYSDLINRPTNLVSTNTAQTISGMKTFSGDITLSGTTSIKNNTGGTNYTMMYRDASTIHVGASTSALKLEGSGTRPAYNNDSLALLSDITGGLPSQTGNAGKFLITNGTDASWGTTISEPLSVINTTNANTTSLILGNGSDSDRYFKIVPSYASTNVALYFGSYLVGSFGAFSFAPSNNLDFSIGTSFKKLSYVYTAKINNGADITVPNQAGTMVVADSTSATAGQVLTLDSNLQPVWAAPGGGAVASGMTLVAADWSNNTQTVLIAGVTSSSIVFVAPDPADTTNYVNAGILCAAQGQDSLTFTCTTTPTVDVAVNIVVM